MNDMTALATRLSDERFVSLTTYKRSGEGVATPMWIVRDGAHLSAWTPADSWKVKRARRDPRVTLRACGRTGRVDPGEPVLEGTAEVVTDPGEVFRVEGLVKRKYGLEFRVMTLIETIAARGRKSRVVLRISPQPTKGS
jgi:PPOX class probable F420-dependent enzyme